MGLLWSYVKPLVRFLMYWLVIGLLLPKNLENRALHIFAGMIMVAFITDCLSAGTKSVVKNKALVRKINLPREMFPVASVIVSMYHMIPMYVDRDHRLHLCALAARSRSASRPRCWRSPSRRSGASGLALLLSAWNVYYRDIGNVVDVIQTVITWTVPMIYPFSAVA